MKTTLKEFINEADNNGNLYYEAAKKVLKSKRVRLHPARIEALLDKLKSDKHLSYDEMSMDKAEADISKAIDAVDKIKEYINEDATPSNVNGMGPTSMPGVGDGTVGSGDKIHDLAAGATGQETNESKDEDRLKELEDEIEAIRRGKKEGRIIPLDQERKALMRKLRTGTSSYVKCHGPNKGKPIRESFLNFTDFVNEDWKDDMKEYDKRVAAWTTELTELLQDKMLGRLPNEDIKVVYDSIVEFKTRVDELQLNWAMYYDETRTKPEVRVEVSSPNKPGAYTKKVTGKNASPAKVWDMIQNIYNGKFKR